MHLTDHAHQQVMHMPPSQSGCSIASDSGSSSLSDIYQVGTAVLIGCVELKKMIFLHFAVRSSYFNPLRSLLVPTGALPVKVHHVRRSVLLWAKGHMLKMNLTFKRSVLHGVEPPRRSAEDIPQHTPGTCTV